MTGDAWTNNEIRVDVDENKQAYSRKLIIKDLSNEDKTRLQNVYRYENKKAKIKSKLKEIKNA